MSHRLAIEIGRWSTIPISGDNGLCHFCSYDVLQMRHTLCWSVPYITPLQISFNHYFEKVVLGSPKSFFQLDQQVDDIGLYLTEATRLCHS